MTKPAAQAQIQTAALSKGCTFHHVGFVVASITEAGRSLAESIGAQWDGQIIHDPLQAARVAFLRFENPDTPAIELVEPAGEASPLHRFLQRGGGLHHVCFQVDSLENQLQACRAAGGLVVKPPLPAVAFGSRRIAWIYSKHKLLVEYLER